ncbi:MAG TPA: serine--tRNA ligase [Candidatus Paceibacterota bacterium]
MLDIKFIRQNTEAVKQAIKNKGLALDLDRLLKVDEERRSLIARSEAIRAEQKKTTDRERAKALKEEFKALELQLKIAAEEYDRLMDQVPTIPSPDTPIGRDADENIEVYRWGDTPEFDFKPKDHIELGTSLDIIDFDRGVKTAGFRGYYLKNQGAQLAMALMMFAFNKMVEKGYKPMIPPTLIGEQFLYGSGYFKESKYNPSIDEIYRVESSEEGEPKKYLVGTAEPSLLAYHSGEVLKERDLPIKFAGFSQCYRSEIGSYGKDTKGIYRVHEFMKVEQVVISKADIPESDSLQKEMVDITKEIHEELELPYRVIQICTGDLSAGKYKQFDYEVWLPGMNRWAETGSASNFLDWQARRLDIKYVDADGERKFAYLLNNTALPTPRPIIGILENFQTKKGTVKIPKALQKYMGGAKEIEK